MSNTRGMKLLLLTLLKAAHVHTGFDSAAADRASVQYSEGDIDVDLPDKFAPLVEDGFEASLISPTHHATLTATLEDVGMYAHAR